MSDKRISQIKRYGVGKRFPASILVGAEPDPPSWPKRPLGRLWQVCIHSPYERALLGMRALRKGSVGRF